ncbi:Disease resistance protein L6 [Linum perenne]
MASNSLSADTMVPLPTGEYEVFLSFRGPDVRHTFADCLYNCLVRSKIRTFRDEEELQKGETIAPSLVKAITESKIYIPIFTRSYASSKWCLQELAEMVKCWKTGKGHLILPIFYLMDPRDVRHQEAGPYKEAFQQHCLKHDQQTVMAWREALQEVGKMKGWHVTESNGLGAVIDQVLTKVELHLRANYTLVTDELVGIDFHIEEVIKLLNFDFASDKIVGIHGMGGLGKTTLAKAVYNEVSAQFDRCCFLEDVREILSKDGGAVTLQNIIISNILRTESDKARNGNDGNQVIKDRVSKHKLLIVLDDVDERFQFDDILGKLSNFSVDSRFLITTRDARVLELLQQCRLYELGAMSHDYALKLFSKHAFGEGYPPEDYSTLSEEFVQVAAGLPLALKVIGSLLFHTNKRFWEAKLIELKEIPPTKVQERLKISYNELTYNEKQIFLDVACLFIGADTEMPFCMWSDCDFYPESTLRTLAQRCFLRMSENKEFWMHDHVRDLGRAIVREENNQNPCKRSRVWSNRDALNMLKHGQGTDCVEAIIVDLEGENHELTNQDFKNLSRLRYLDVRNGRLIGNFKEVLPNIRCLRLSSCDSVPTDLNLNSLVVLDLQDCPVRDGWRGWNEIKVARKLKVVSLLNCYNLSKVPDLSICESLELLDFSGCGWMRGELDIGNFKKLRLLMVRGTRITKLRGDIGTLQYLQKIDLSFTSLIEVPTGVSKLSSLQVLDLMYIKVPHVTENFPDGLKSLSISSFSVPSLPSSLSYFDIRYCKYLQWLPNLANLSNLRVLHLHEVGIREIPGLGDMRMLASLYISDAPNLVDLDGLENLLLLEELSVHSCWLLRKLPSLANLTKLHKLEISWCGSLIEIHGVGKLWGSLLHLDMRQCSSLTDMEALQSMVKLETLILVELQFAKILPPSMSMFTKLKRLTIGESFRPTDDKHLISLRKFPDLSNLKNLRELNVWYCSEVIEVTGLDRLEKLEILVIQECNSIRKLPDLSGLIFLKKLEVSLCAQLTEIKGLGKLESLEDLYLLGCSSIKELPNLSGMKRLRRLNLKGCTKLKDVNGLEELELLEELDTDKRLVVKHVMKSVARYGKHLLTKVARGGSVTN